MWLATFKGALISTVFSGPAWDFTKYEKMTLMMTLGLAFVTKFVCGSLERYRKGSDQTQSTCIMGGVGPNLAVIVHGTKRNPPGRAPAFEASLHICQSAKNVSI